MAKYLYRNTTDSTMVIANVGAVEAGDTIHSEEELFIAGLKNVEKPEAHVEGQPMFGDTKEEVYKPKAEVVGEEPKKHKGSIK